MTVIKVALRIRMLLAVFVLVTILAACSRQPDIPLTGKVTDAYTGQPIPDATINMGTMNLMTDASGRYYIPIWGLIQRAPKTCSERMYTSL